MREKTKWRVNRSGWPPGPWDDEPDKLQFKTRAGLPGLIVRNGSGALCGYVGISEGHKYFDHTHCESIDLEVHGGITYGHKCQGPVCHVPDPGEPDDVFWLGFDCAHARDLVPNEVDFQRRHGLTLAGSEYRDIAYVREQCEHLAEQLAAL